MRLYLGDVTLVVGSILALGIVGIEQQLHAPFFPVYLSLVAYLVYHRHQPQHQAWQALAS